MIKPEMNPTREAIAQKKISRMSIKEIEDMLEELRNDGIHKDMQILLENELELRSE